MTDLQQCPSCGTPLCESGLELSCPECGPVVLDELGIVAGGVSGDDPEVVDVMKQYAQKREVADRLDEIDFTDRKPHLPK